ncbi:MAG: FeoB-associated Cys-rich membrane protein [Agathobacter sp.]|nr:FeoB-associated Cys-rich membrane protein [Agathobacter sp.]
MNDIIIVGIILFLVGLAISYIRKEKKKGNKCVGCPSAGSCQSKSCCPQKQDHQDK